MKINIDQTRGLLIHFPPPELRVALSVLKALYTVSKASFIKSAIEEVEMMLRPRLTLVSHYHYCHNCQMEIDDRVGDNFIHYTSETDDKWFHRYCTPLKENRPEN
jgi:hypothetical protein